MALARVVLTQAPLWLLDEPLNALDAPAQAAFRAALAGTSRGRRPRHRRDPCAISASPARASLELAAMSGFSALLTRDLRLVWRRPGDVVVVLAFFVVATVLFPLGIGPETNVLARIAAGVLWCAALFAALLSLDRLFAADYEDGTLDLLLLAPWPLELAALAKCLAHWIVTGLPLGLLAPVLGVAFGLDRPSLLAPGRDPAGRHAHPVADRRAGGGAHARARAVGRAAGPARPAALRADADLRRRRGRGAGDGRGFRAHICDPGARWPWSPWPRRRGRLPPPCGKPANRREDGR